MAVEKVKATVKKEIAPNVEAATKVVAEETKAAAKKATAATKTIAKKASTATKTATRKAAETVKEAKPKKATTKTAITLEYSDKKYTTADLEKIATDVWVYDYGKKASELKTVELYVKPLESRVYYVFNGDIVGSFKI